MRIKYIIIVSFFICCIFSCGRVKNEPVRVIQPDSIFYSFVIQVNEVGNYLVYIPDESERIKTSQLMPSKVYISDSIWTVQLTDIDTCIKAFKKATASNDVKINIEADSQAEYKSIKNLMGHLQDSGCSRYYLTTRH